MMEITTPKSFFQQLVDVLKTHGHAGIPLEQIPESYRHGSGPANLCNKLRTRASLYVTNERVGKIVFFKISK